MKKNSTRKKHSRGGARRGAGRKPLGRIKRLLSFTPATLAELQRRAKEQNIAMGFVIDGLLTPEGTAI